jgi:hypothetical protein
MPKEVHGYGKRCFMEGRIVIYHQLQTEFVASILQQADADQPPSMLAHEIDDLRGNAAGSSNEIALVLAVLIVYDDNDFSPFEIFYGAFY